MKKMFIKQLKELIMTKVKEKIEMKVNHLLSTHNFTQIIQKKFLEFNYKIY